MGWTDRLVARQQASPPVPSVMFIAAWFFLHVVDGSSEDLIGDFTTINGELEQYDPFLAQKPQVVVLNKIDIPEVKEKKDELMERLRAATGHSRVSSISALTTERVQELIGRLKKFAAAQPVVDLPPFQKLIWARLDWIMIVMIMIHPILVNGVFVEKDLHAGGRRRTSRLGGT